MRRGSPPDEMVVICGAGGAVGSAAVQIAVAAGCRVIAVAGARDTDWVAGRYWITGIRTCWRNWATLPGKAPR
ncbi:hypothetical protein [Paeniglutamicibacter antarcticus]|uniref:Uncharacterized protein n=1 Tax=Paeniglutamicibacter antarcticus TaxID=494023 RepID=A0ABP9TKN0_9MICC